MLVFLLIGGIQIHHNDVNALSNDVRPLSKEDFVFEGIAPGDFCNEALLKKLGNIKKIIKKYEGDIPIAEYLYSNFIIDVYLDVPSRSELRPLYIARVFIINNNECTSRGIKIGDNISEVLRAYGPFSKNDDSSGHINYIYKYHSKEQTFDSYVIVFSVNSTDNSNRIESIVIDIW